MDRPPPDAEFDVIARITSRVSAGLLPLGPGDDAAILASGAVWTTDMLVQDTHFDGRLSPADIAYKAVAANVSDLAAMGAAPQAMLLSLGLPDADGAWVDSFADGLAEACHRWRVALVGGDTVRAAVVIVNIAMGGHCVARPMTRKGAREGDALWVTGTLGVAGRAWQEPHPPEASLAAWRRPDPPLDAALALARWGRVTAAMDLSDGLATDLRRLTVASGVGASVDVDAIPGGSGDVVWTGGEDYELLFTTGPSDDPRPHVEATGRRATRIGTMTGAVGDSGWPTPAWTHFAGAA